MFLTAITLFPAGPSVPQSASRQDALESSGSSLVAIQQLAMPPEAARAFEKGTTLLKFGEPEASLAYFQSSIYLAPSSFPPYHNLAIAQYDLGRLNDATENFQTAIDLSKGSFAPAFFGLAMVLYRHGHLAEAQLNVERGLLVVPDSAVGRYCLGLTQYSLGNTADAQNSALEALRVDPRLAAAHLLLAHVHERLRDDNAVITDVEAYFQVASNGRLRDDARALLQRARHRLAGH